MMNCGECNICCKLLKINSTESPIGEYCKHCTGSGCDIYGDHPEECQQYQCMWSQMPEKFARIELRPDKSGIIFDRQSDDVIAARLEENKKISQLLLKQIESFTKEGFSVIVFRGIENKIFLKDGHTEEYVKEIIDGRSKLLDRPN